MKPGHGPPAETVSGSAGAEKIVIWTLLALVAVLLRGRHFVDLLRPEETVIVDFFQEWASARNFLNGRPIYQNQEISLEQYLDVKPGKSALIEYNAHPPSAVLLAIPFGYLSYPDAVFAWNLLSLFAAGLCVLLVLRELRLHVPPWGIFPALVFCLTAFPFLAQVRHAQINLVLLLLITGTWIAARRRLPWLAGLLLATASVLKLLPAFVFFFFLVRREWKVVLCGVVSTLCLLGITALVLGGQCFADYVNVCLPYFSPNRSRWLCLSWVGFVGKTINPTDVSEHVAPLAHLPLLANVVTVLGIVALVAVLTSIAVKAQDRSQWDLAFALTLVTTLLISPITWPHYLLLLALPILLLWAHLPHVGVSRWWLGIPLVAFWVPPFFVLGLFGLPAEHRYVVTARPWQSLTVLSFQFYALFTLFCLITWTSRRMRLAPRLTSANCR